MSTHVYINTNLPFYTVQRPTASCCGLKIHLICCSGSQQTFYKPARHLFCQARATSLILIDSTQFVSSSYQSYFKIPWAIYSTSSLPIHVAPWSYVEKLVYTKSSIICLKYWTMTPYYNDAHVYNHITTVHHVLLSFQPCWKKPAFQLISPNAFSIHIDQISLQYSFYAT